MSQNGNHSILSMQGKLNKSTGTTHSDRFFSRIGKTEIKTNLFFSSLTFQWRWQTSDMEVFSLQKFFLFNMHQINARAKKNETLVEKERHNKKTSERQREKRREGKTKIHQTEKTKIEIVVVFF